MADPINLARYTIGWIAPMPLELAPAVALLEEHITVPVPADGTLYHAGRVGDHYVVMVVCPRMGTNPASATVTNLCRSFPNIVHILVVGIAGGVPRYGLDMREQIVLGDVVVSVPQKRDGGVAHYEFGSLEDGGKLRVSGHTLHPSRELLIAVGNLRSSHMQREGTKIPLFLQKLRTRLAEHEVPEFQDPGPEHDRLFHADYSHTDRKRSCRTLCDKTRSTLRADRGPRALRVPDTPAIHYGTIGSANALVISSEKRNQLHNEHGNICFEMESAGIMSERQGLVVRGICDYADSHKNKRWQKYAAATAAACAKEILLFLPSTERPRMPSRAAVTEPGSVELASKSHQSVFLPGSGHSLVFSINNFGSPNHQPFIKFETMSPTMADTPSWHEALNSQPPSRVLSLPKLQSESLVKSLIKVPGLDHQEIYKMSLVQRDRRKMGRRYTSISDDLAEKLQHIGDQDRSSLAVIEAFDADRLILKDISTDLVELLVDAHIPVLWVLYPAYLPEDRPFTTTELLRSLCLQALELDNSKQKNNFDASRAAQIQEANTPQDWISILASTLAVFSLVYIVIDVDTGWQEGDHDHCSWLLAVTTLMSALTQRVPGPKLKTILISVSSGIESLLGKGTLQLDNRIKVPRLVLSKTRKRRGQRGKRPGLMLGGMKD